MAQQLKEDVRARITAAALEAFAAQGFVAATMAGIAGAAGVSAGNLYRYFHDKQVLFAEVVPDELARGLARLVRQRVEALRGVADVQTLAEDAPWRALSAELVSLCIEHRLAVVVLLAPGKARGTEHESFSERMVDELCKLAVAHARSVRASFELTRARRFTLRRIYRGFVDTMVAILADHDESAAIRDAIGRFSSYHLAGLRAFFEETAT